MHGRRAEASIAVPFVLVPGLGGHGWNNNDPAIPGDFNPRDVHTGAADGLDRSGNVLLPECGGGARHWITVAKPAYRRAFSGGQSVAPRGERPRGGHGRGAAGEGTGVEGVTLGRSFCSGPFCVSEISETPERCPSGCCLQPLM